MGQGPQFTGNVGAPNLPGNQVLIGQFGTVPYPFFKNNRTVTLIDPNSVIQQNFSVSLQLPNQNLGMVKVGMQSLFWNKNNAWSDFFLVSQTLTFTLQNVPVVTIPITPEMFQIGGTGTFEGYMPNITNPPGGWFNTPTLSLLSPRGSGSSMQGYINYFPSFTTMRIPPLFFYPSPPDSNYTQTTPSPDATKIDLTYLVQLWEFNSIFDNIQFNVSMVNTNTLPPPPGTFNTYADTSLFAIAA